MQFLNALDKEVKYSYQFQAGDFISSLILGKAVLHFTRKEIVHIPLFGAPNRWVSFYLIETVTRTNIK